MSSDKNYGTIAPKIVGGVLTAAYGDESAGWTTKGIDVRRYSVIALELTYTQKDAGAPAQLLTILPYGGEATSADLDAYVPVYDANATALTLDIRTLDVSALGNDAVQKALIQLDVTALSMLRVAALVDVDTDDPELVMRYLGYSEVGAVVTSPDVA